jgi:hypothetical protein
MDKLHITQDDYGYWMLSLEKEDGTLTLVAHQFAAPDHLIENANEMIAEGKVRAVVVIDPPRPSVPAPTTRALPADYQKPAPRKAGA